MTNNNQGRGSADSKSEMEEKDARKGNTNQKDTDSEARTNNPANREGSENKGGMGGNSGNDPNRR